MNPFHKELIPCSWPCIKFVPQEMILWFLQRRVDMTKDVQTYHSSRKLSLARIMVANLHEQPSNIITNRPNCFFLQSFFVLPSFLDQWQRHYVKVIFFETPKNKQIYIKNVKMRQYINQPNVHHCGFNLFLKCCCSDYCVCSLPWFVPVMDTSLSHGWVHQIIVGHFPYFFLKILFLFQHCWFLIYIQHNYLHYRGFMLRCILVVVDKNFFLLQFNNQILRVNSYFFCLLPFESCNTFCLGTLELYLSVVAIIFMMGAKITTFERKSKYFDHAWTPYKVTISHYTVMSWKYMSTWGEYLAKCA